jgi:probable rRNA maturation factor
MPASNTPKTAQKKTSPTKPSAPNPAAPKKFPTIAIHNRQKKFRLPLRRLQARTEAAVCRLAHRLPRNLQTLEITFLSPAASGRIHAQFLGDPTPTDVITFHHGELLICPAVAERQRHAEGLSLEDELLTYILHGLLHLCGEDDATERGYQRMRRAQTRLLRCL